MTIRFRHTVFFTISIFLLGAMMKGQPLQFPGDDMNILIYASETSWKELWLYFIKPAPLYVHGYEAYSTVRIFETIIFKLVYTFFGVNPNPLLFIKALSGAIVVTFTYLISNSLVAAILLLTFVGFVRATTWVADFEVVAQAFMCLSFYFFIKQISTKTEN